MPSSHRQALPLIAGDLDAAGQATRLTRGGYAPSYSCGVLGRSETAGDLGLITGVGFITAAPGGAKPCCDRLTGEQPLIEDLCAAIQPVEPRAYRRAVLGDAEDDIPGRSAPAAVTNRLCREG